MESKIPKKIHYCWFGGNSLPELVQKCIASWRKFLPDYEIVEWNEQNFDIDCCKYVREAYAAKKWAFVADYCRIWVLNKSGGLYFDTDVELIKTPEKLFQTPCMGFETSEIINPGLVLVAPSNNWFCDEMLATYEKDSFVLKAGKINLKTICDRATEILVSHGLILNNEQQTVDGFTIYPIEYFNPRDYHTAKIRPTDKTVSIHHYAATWVDRKTKFKHKFYVTIYRIFGKKIVFKIKKFFRKNKK